MDGLPAVLLILIILVLIWSVVEFIHGKQKSGQRETIFSMEIFYTLLIVYLVVIIGFGLIYFTLSLNNILLVENGELRKVSTQGSLVHSFYFSGVTLLTIGYGDITPVGIGRLIALIQALIGYILPAAFVLRLVVTNREVRDSRRDVL